MEEQQIKANLPDLYEYLSEIIKSQAHWAGICKDLEGLNWLNRENQSVESLVQGYFSHIERFVQSLPQETEFFPTFTLNRVKVWIYDSFFYFISYKDKCQDLCIKFKQSLKALSFFAKANELITAASDSELNEVVTSIEKNLVGLKSYVVETAIHMSKPLQDEFDKDLQEIIDECFYNEALEQHKAKLKENDETRKVLKDYKPSVYFSSNRYSNSIYNTYNKLDNIYVGQMTHDRKRQGYGKMYFSNMTYYEGNWENDKPEGKGLCTWKDGGKYLGELKSGRLEGKGKRLYSNGNYYEGCFANGRRSGKGKMKFKNGDSYDGEWSSDEMQGNGMYVWNSGDAYIGEFNRDKKHGKGTLTLSSGEVYQGTWTNGVYKNEVSS
jgi:hypothetical protein